MGGGTPWWVYTSLGMYTTYTSWVYLPPCTTRSPHGYVISMLWVTDDEALGSNLRLIK